MTFARRKGQEYELVNFTDNAEWVLRDAQGDVLVEESDDVEVQCERCGRWSTHAAPTGPWRRWVCQDTSCYAAEMAPP